MAPTGLMISKLGIQASANDQIVKGLLCMKISLPNESEGHSPSRWGLFQSHPPKLTSNPTIHALPLPISRKTSQSHLQRTASRLLGIQVPATYPPSPPSGLAVKPYLDVSSTTGQVYVVLDPGGGRKRRDSSSGNGGGSSGHANTGRRDWLIIMEVESKMELHGGTSKVLLSLPKCLDNVIRFQITSSPTNQGEVSILTEPKLLPLPASTFARASSSSIIKGKNNGKGKGKGKAAKLGAEEGWEDGEHLSSDDDGSDNGSSGSDEGDWLEGRFQSTDQLRLEWSFSNTDGSDHPTLQIQPIYDTRHPAIHLIYETTLNDGDLVVDLPDGWGWSEISMAGEIQSWRCTDNQWWDDMLSSTTISRTSIKSEDEDGDETIDMDDSFSTIRAGSKRKSKPTSLLPPNPKHTGASLLRQTIPEMKIEDFSFEIGSEPISKPMTPGKGRENHSILNGSVSTIPVPPLSLSTPLPGRRFEVTPSANGDGQITLQATLRPLSKMTLVHPDVPVVIPSIRNGNGNEEELVVVCPCASYPGDEGETSEAQQRKVPLQATFRWSDHLGADLSKDPEPASIGDVKVDLEKAAGRTTYTIWILQDLRPDTKPKGGSGIGMITIPCRSEDIRIMNVSGKGGRSISRSSVSKSRETQIYFQNAEEGTVQIVIESYSDSILLPQIEDATGQLSVRFTGESWDLRNINLKTNMKRRSTNTYTYNLSSKTPPNLAIQPKSRSSFQSRTLFSWSTFVNLFMLWLLLSMGQQIQRLRSEVAFVAEEAKDLRMYSMASARADPPSPIIPGQQQIPAQEQEQLSGQKQDITTPNRKDTGDLGHDFKDENIEAREDRYERKRSVSRKDAGVSTALGRVVFGRSGWEAFSNHPTIQSLSKSLGWIWHTVFWMIIPGH